MIFNCRRCGHIEKHKGNFLKHLNRKTTCKPILEDVDIETLKDELETKSVKSLLKVVPVVETVVPVVEEKKTQYICTGCKKEFKNNKYLKQHINRYGCEKKIIEDIKVAQLEEKLAQKDAEMAQKDKEMEILIGYTKEQMDFMKKQIEILMKKAGNTTNTDNSTTNNNINNSTNIENQQINIHINGFGKEDLSYITDRHFREWFNGPFSAIPNLVEYIHFNPKKPQNWNAKIPDDKTSKALIYNAEKEMWVKREKKEVINDMVEKSYNMLDTNFEIQKEAKTLDEKGKRKFENFMKIYDKGNKQLDKRYEIEIREKLMNFKEYHIKL
tara:strand:+ start:4971 stop:5951 length:981 start_codon:yes stop_codon:yes gene_type:complete